MTERIKDKIPIDRQTAIVTGKGIHWEPSNKSKRRHWDKCPPLLHRGGKGSERLKGIKFGYFTVIGRYHLRKAGGKAVWVVRCVCGHFEARRAKSILNPSDKEEDMCANCKEVKSLREKKESTDADT